MGRIRNPWIWYERHFWPILGVLSFLGLVLELYRYLFR